MNTILGLDLGTNSIGWSLIQLDDQNAPSGILGAGSRILPMSADMISDFNKGVVVTAARERTRLRMARRLKERFLLRRQRLHRVLNLLDWLPAHYAAAIDFNKHPGQFIDHQEPKLAYAYNGESKHYEFLFHDAFKEMLALFQQHQPALVADGKKVPYDWTIYYLRTKALTQPLSAQELAWVILQFNQKRGYQAARGEEEEGKKENKKEEFHTLTITAVNEAPDNLPGRLKWYHCQLDNGWIYPTKSEAAFSWVGKPRDFIVSTEVDENGKEKTGKDGKVRRSFRAPADGDWTLRKKRTEHQIERSGKTLGEYIFTELLRDGSIKIKGKLVHTVDRELYRHELRQILEAQAAFHPQLSDPQVLESAAWHLYPNNDGHRLSVLNKTLTDLIADDILFYQRPLKSKKHLIEKCRFEKRFYRQDGVLKTEQLPCIAKTHPLYQEYRVWQWLHNLRIYERDKNVNGKLLTEVDVTALFLPDNLSKEKLFDALMQLGSIKQKNLLKLVTGLKKTDHLRWNYVDEEEKEFPLNETRALMTKRLDKAGIDNAFLTPEREVQLWHMLYSITNLKELENALRKYIGKQVFSNAVDEAAFVEAFRKFPPMHGSYGAYSEKAIKKLLSVMRLGRHWRLDAIDPNTRERISVAMQENGFAEADERVRKVLSHCHQEEDFQGLPQYAASYLVYGKHSEATDTERWESPDAITLLPQHSLRNPIVEKVINETLMVVKDIWNQYGKGQKDFFSEIHMELGREMKNPNDKRKKITESIQKNELRNLRMKLLLQEMFDEQAAENVRPYSPVQAEILSLYEEGVLSMAAEPLPDYVGKILKDPRISRSDLTRYRLWIDQQYRSPYTGETIPLSKLFTPAYEIEHIIPRSLYSDDSLNNKIICETEVNKLKGNRLAYVFIQKEATRILTLPGGGQTKILTPELYQDVIKKQFGSKELRGKLKRLLMEEVPEEFVQRQLNDSRYISREVKGLLSRMVREENEQEATAKRVVSVTGGVTSQLRQDWGLNHIWNELVAPRFQRLNQLQNTNAYGQINPNTGKFLPSVPLEMSRGFSTKRIDHRHHALDAIVIACASRSHVNFLNNVAAADTDTNFDEKALQRKQMQNKLCEKDPSHQANGGYRWQFKKPWDTFTQDVHRVLDQMIVSFKQNLRVVTAATNAYTVMEADADGHKKRQIRRQTGQNKAIRKPLHADTVYGQVSLPELKTVRLNEAIAQPDLIMDKALKGWIQATLAKGKTAKQVADELKKTGHPETGESITNTQIRRLNPDYAAARVTLNDTFTRAMIESITDSGIRQILRNHLDRYTYLDKGKKVDDAARAFSPEGIEEMNANITELNGGKPHKPIYKVRKFEPVGNKFSVGTEGTKSSKLVQAAKGTNLYFAVYEDEKGKRSYETVPLKVVVERIKQGLGPVPETQGEKKLIVHFSPQDLVAVVDTPDATFSGNSVYKVVSFTENRMFGIPHHSANSIADKIEFSLKNKVEFSLEGLSLKEKGKKVEVNRLGQIINP